MKNLAGVWVAQITPFTKNGDVDLQKLADQTRRLVQAGVHGLCPAGTTGEGWALTDREFSKVVECVVEASGKKVHIYAGTGAISTSQTIERTKIAKASGASGALVVTPYYVKPTPAGLLLHYSKISDAVDLPLMLYNVSGRTSVNMLPDTAAQIVERANVTAIKECAPLSQVSELIARVGNKVTILSGEDGAFLPFLSIGGDGVVSVAGNLIANEWCSLYEAYHKGDVEKAQTTFLKWRKLVDVLFVESNPIPVKTAMAFQDKCEAYFREPLCAMAPKNVELLRTVLAEIRGME